MAKARRAYETGSWQRISPEKVRLWYSCKTAGLGGKRQRRSRVVLARTDAAAERALKAFIRECDEKQGRGGMTLRALIDEFMSVHVSDLAPNSQRWYEDSLRRTLAAMGHIRIEDLSPITIEKFYKALADPDAGAFEEGYPNGLSDTYIAHHHRALSTVLRWGYRKGLISQPIIDRVDAPAAGGKSEHAFALDEAQRKAFREALEAEAQRCSLAVSETDRELQSLGWLMLGRVALFTGMRRGELLGIAWEDIEGDVLRVRHQVQSIKGELQLCELKTAASVRDLRLTPELQEQLQRLRKLQLAHALRFGLPRPQMVFQTLEGGMRDPAHVAKFFKRVFVRAGLPEASMHTLRHTCGSVLLSAGFSPADVAYYLGHSTPNVTLGVYAHKFTSELDRMSALASARLL